MLYDNALLLRVYTHLWRLTGDAFAGRIADELAAFLLDPDGLYLGTDGGYLGADGGFASALDADTGGEEGATYVWTPGQLREVLGDEDGAFAADLFGVTAAGTFEHGTSVLRLARDIDDAAPEVVARWRRVREALLVARKRRPQPMRDEKVVAAWNGLAVTALVEYAGVRTPPSAGSRATADLASGQPDQDSGQPKQEQPDTALAEPVEPGLGERVVAVAHLLAERHLVDGRLRRVSRDGVVGEPAGVLEDYGCVAEAFCATHQLTAEGRWLSLAGQLLDTGLEQFGTGSGGFFDTADDAERLVTRPADPTDNATPSGLSAVSAALTTYTALAGSTRHREAAEAALATVAPIMSRHARFTGYACAVAEAQLAGPYEIAIATGDPAGDPLVRTAWRLAPPGAVIVAGEPDLPGVPLLAQRPMISGQSAAYVCRGFVCDRPVTTPGELAAALGHQGDLPV
jgi:uncharacterized protein YyaL (SSP411 family)